MAYKFDFDVAYDWKHVLQLFLEVRMLIKNDRELKDFTFVEVGPGGGNPNIMISTTDYDDAQNIRRWLTEHKISYSDETGETHEFM